MPTLHAMADTAGIEGTATEGRTDSPVIAFLQPIVSVRQQSIRMVEALARSRDGHGNLLTPAALFGRADAIGRRAELERACRLAGLDAYRKVVHPAFEPVLSLNADTSLVLAGARGAEVLASDAADRGVAPSSIAIEILESAFSDSRELERFCRAARALGFLLALDDVGTGHSNLERIPRLEPDILKIDRTLVENMSTSYHRREVFRALLALSHQIGAVVIAEGVEHEEDVLTGLSLGCDLFQGFYFGAPRDPGDGGALHDQERVLQMGRKLRQQAISRLNDRRVRQRNNELVLASLVERMRPLHEPEFEAALLDAVERESFVEALYVLDEHGLQVTETAYRTPPAERRRTLFRPAPRGADQSLKHYFLMLDAGLEKFTSDPYISSASGSYCITMSRYFGNILGRRYVLCCDIVVPSAT